MVQNLNHYQTLFLSMTSSCEISNIEVILVSDSGLALNIGFFGYSYDDVEKYLNKNFVECEKPYAQRWSQMKYVNRG